MQPPVKLDHADDCRLDEKLSSRPETSLMKARPFIFSTLLLLAGCNRPIQSKPDHPRLTPGVRMQDITFHSVSLNRDMQYRVILPSTAVLDKGLPVIYLLHGRGGNFRDWSNYSDVAKYAESGFLLVMPEGGASYYTNAVDRPADRYEDYIVKDLIADVEARFSAATGRASRAIVGVSMGGFGAIKIALVHPDTYAFAAGLSSALDVPSRPFSIKRLGQWRFHRSIFGPSGSQTRRNNDPLLLVRSADPAAVPYIFLTCGEQEGLLPSNRQFAQLLADRKFRFEFHAVPGAHNWNQWNARLPALFESLTAYVHPKK
jgi:S-formylglutathione hydrolase FrmB